MCMNSHVFSAPIEGVPLRIYFRINRLTLCSLKTPGRVMSPLSARKRTHKNMSDVRAVIGLVVFDYKVGLVPDPIHVVTVMWCSVCWYSNIYMQQTFQMQGWIGGYCYKCRFKIFIFLSSRQGGEYTLRDESFLCICAHWKGALLCSFDQSCDSG